MRVIAGSRARTPLLGPRDCTTRPITDRVKESLFSILGLLVTDIVVADLFCGTGSLGLEALSRGAQRAIMMDKDREALQRLRKNIEKLNFEDRTEVIRGDVFKVDISAAQCRMVFVDPPYRLTQDTSLESPVGSLLVKLSEQMTAQSIVVLRHQRQSEILPCYAALQQYDQRVYGSMALTFLEKAGNT